MPDYALAGKTVMVTGAGKGIGLAIAQAYAAQGCRLLVVDRDAQALEAAEFPGAAGTHKLACDLGIVDDLQPLQEETRSFPPTLDVLVNNAGVEYATPI